MQFFYIQFSWYFEMFLVKFNKCALKNTYQYVVECIKGDNCSQHTIRINFLSYLNGSSFLCFNSIVKSKVLKETYHQLTMKIVPFSYFMHTKLDFSVHFAVGFPFYRQHAQITILMQSFWVSYLPSLFRQWEIQIQTQYCLVVIWSTV